MEDKPLSVRMGALVRQLRQEAHESQEDFADRCGLHRTYVGSIERGEKNITVETAKKLCDAFGIPLSRFFQLLEAGHK